MAMNHKNGKSYKSYKESGVDIELADTFVERIKKLVGKTYDDRTMSGVGGFAALYKMDEERFLASSTDGVGTKLKLAIETGNHSTIGIDLVAMCVNDLICTGARPLFFLDYFAMGKLDVKVGEQVVSGIVQGCLESRMALLGGETAEMPGMYQAGDYDLAGFSVGEVRKADLIDGSRLKEGDSLVGVASSGFHSNGFSLVRRIIDQEQNPAIKRRLQEQCLTPTRIYVKTAEILQKELGSSLKGIAHITGSGLLNIPRINENFDYILKDLPSQSERPAVMNEVLERSQMTLREQAITFNMGIGLVLATDQPERTLALLRANNERAWILGQVQQGQGKVSLFNETL